MVPPLVIGLPAVLPDAKIAMSPHEQGGMMEHVDPVASEANHADDQADWPGGGFDSG